MLPTAPSVMFNGSFSTIQLESFKWKRRTLPKQGIAGKGQKCYPGVEPTYVGNK